MGVTAKRPQFVVWMILSVILGGLTVIFRNSLPPILSWVGPAWPVGAYAIGHVIWGERRQGGIVLGLWVAGLAVFGLMWLK